MSRHFKFEVHVELPGDDEREEIFIDHLRNRIQEAPGFKQLKGRLSETEQT